MTAWTDSHRDLGSARAEAGTGLLPDRQGWPIRRLLREPILHFLAVGIVVFGAYRVLHPSPQSDDEPRQIEITQDDLRQMAVVWLAQGRPAPTPQQMRALVEQKITSEVLYREAIALGLDQDDEIIKRRLAQKMDFLVADVAAIVPIPRLSEGRLSRRVDSVPARQEARNVFNAWSCRQQRQRSSRRRPQSYLPATRSRVDCCEPPERLRCSR